MSNNLQKTYTLTKTLFPGINKVCSNCNTCCKTYGWILDNEAQCFSKKGFQTVLINNSISCIDSFRRNTQNKLIIDKIPRCVFYKKKRCTINQTKPFDCRLYPIKIKFHGEQAFVGLSLGCKYISSLSPIKKNKIFNNVIKFFSQCPNNVINDYLNLMYEVSLITNPKRFWMQEILKIDKENNSWRLQDLKILSLEKRHYKS